MISKVTTTEEAEHQYDVRNQRRTVCKSNMIKKKKTRNLHYIKNGYTNYLQTKKRQNTKNMKSHLLPAEFVPV